jgi:hypothetical protein
MRRLALSLASLLLLTPAGAAQARGGVRLQSATLDLGTRRLMLVLRCGGSARRCGGTLVLAANGGGRLAYRRVQLSRRHVSRVFLHLARAAVPTAARGDSHVSLYDRTGRTTALDDLHPALRTHSCTGGETVAAADGVRVFRAGGVAVFACGAGGRRPVPLQVENGSDIQAVHLAGRFIAYTYTAGEYCDTTVHVVGLGRHRLRRRGDVHNFVSLPSDCDSSVAVPRLVLTRAGAVAWSEEAGDRDPPAIRALDDRGERTLASGAGVDPASLRLVGRRTVAWTDSGAEHTATLRAAARR